MLSSIVNYEFTKNLRFKPIPHSPIFQSFCTNIEDIWKTVNIAPRTTFPRIFDLPPKVRSVKISTLEEACVELKRKDCNHCIKLVRSYVKENESFLQSCANVDVLTIHLTFAVQMKTTRVSVTPLSHKINLEKSLQKLTPFTVIQGAY